MTFKRLFGTNTGLKEDNDTLEGQSNLEGGTGPKPEKFLTSLGQEAGKAEKQLAIITARCETMIYRVCNIDKQASTNRSK